MLLTFRPKYLFSSKWKERLFKDLYLYPFQYIYTSQEVGKIKIIITHGMHDLLREICVSPYVFGIVPYGTLFVLVYDM